MHTPQNMEIYEGKTQNITRRKKIKSQLNGEIYHVAG